MIILALVLLLIAGAAGAAPADDKAFLTYYEKSGYTETPRYRGTIDYCEKLAGASRWLHYTSFGTTPQGRDLPLIIANKDGVFDAKRLNRRNSVVLMIQAGIHAGEIDGKDAGLMLLRDIAVTRKYPELLDHVTILFIPIFNVDGHERFGPYNRINQNGPKEMGWRTTAQNLNLNRDYLKADTPEMQAWTRLYNEWLPEFFVDCHVTDGADYQYVLTYSMEIYGNMPPQTTEWTRDAYLPALETALASSGYDLFPYVFMKDWGNPKAGITSWVAPPRFSNGYTAIRNRPGFLLETHMLKDYKTRVTGTYQLLKETLTILNREHAALARAVAQADDFTASKEFRSEPLAVGFAATDATTRIDFKGISYQTTQSELSGGPWYRFTGEPETYQIPFNDEQEVTAFVDVPEAYVIPPEWSTVIDRLELNGVQVERLREPVTLVVDSYKFTSVEWAKAPFEGRFQPSFEIEEIESERTYPAGSAVIDMAQRFARVAACALEPDAPDSYVRWGFFNAIFEQKEGFSSFVMEKIARDMLAKDSELRRAFEQKKTDDPEFAADPRAILTWFYRRSPWWDERKDVYPVGKLYDRGALESMSTD